MTFVSQRAFKKITKSMMVELCEELGADESEIASEIRKDYPIPKEFPDWVRKCMAGFGLYL